MIEVNWNNFKAKFNGKERESFEVLSYLLFCDEFNQRFGIFRYFNQAGIETDPIQINGEWIGFQSKFYETKISDNKKEIKDSIEKAKRKNPELDKISFYLNQEFSESSKKDEKEPQYKTEIEDFAKAKGIEIVWKVPSHFQAQLSHDRNKNLAQYFFSLKKGVVDSIGELRNHTLAILKPIHSQIEFNRTKIKIDRSKTLNGLKKTLRNSQIVILSGEGGVGKTALVKDFYDSIKNTVPLFIFKATEFNILRINNLFKDYGDFTLTDFVGEHTDTDEKYIVVDSAEKLSDLESLEAFQEFLSTLLQNNWKIIFTTRYSYLDDLKFQFVEIYRLSFQLFNIEKINLSELENLSDEHDFILPKEERLLELLQNPFYLNEYLQIYKNFDEITNYSEFKNLLWNKQILKSSHRKNNIHLKRESCFLTIAGRRAKSGSFFVNVEECDESALQALEADEIVKYDSDAAGYFIAHDIYEEWALDKIIERNFRNSDDAKSFFKSLSGSMPVRRAFRNWLSEKLYSSRNEIKSLIEKTFVGDEVEEFWKDEILVSILLSDYSESFFVMFEKMLLADDQKILTRIIFLLRIACKEIDEKLLQLFGLKLKDRFAINTVFTKPKGTGWSCTINFIHKYKEEIPLSKIDIILPLLGDWNSTNKESDTTKKAGQLGLFYYEEIEDKNSRYRFRENIKQLIKIILDSSAEIKNELITIFDKVIFNKETNHRDRYYEIIKAVLSSAAESYEVAKNLPEQVLKLAELFWFESPKEEQSDKEYGYSRMKIEDDFCISVSHHEYYPASAFQTPVFQLLRFAPKATIDFILSFTDKTVECYAKSRFGSEIEEVEVFFEDAKSGRQYASGRLWNMYRGTQVCPNLLESLHMALERWLLDYAKTASQNKLENICKYLLKNTKSASITAVVASLVLAQPFKLFNVAKILFRTKEFFFYDTGRQTLEHGTKSHYSIGYGLNSRNILYDDERIKTCDDEHRKGSLEFIALNYQFVKSPDNEHFDEQRESLWEIWDEHYKKLPPEAEQSEYDKTWQLYLARMDTRKMTFTAEPERDGNRTLITFNPELAPELKKYSEESLQEVSDAGKYLPLNLWAHYRFRREEKSYKQYQKYEDSAQTVLAETKEVIKRLENAANKNSYLLDSSTPAYACAILIRDFADRLNNKEKEFCKQVIFDLAASTLRPEKYSYQITDGSKPAIMTIPLFLKYFPEEENTIKSILLFLLLTDYETETFDSAINAVLNNLWKVNFAAAQSVFLGYLYLKPKYNELWDGMRKSHFKNFSFSDFAEQEVLKPFAEKYEDDLEKFYTNKITYEDLKDLDKLDLRLLNTAFELLPLKTGDEDHKNFAAKISSVFAEKLKDFNENDFAIKHRFLKKFATFVLSSADGEIKTYLEPFVENFENSEIMADFFHEFVAAEDDLNQYEGFWTVWNMFYNKIVELCGNHRSGRYTEQIVHNYLLAWNYWREDAKQWRSLKEREKLFFGKVAEDIGHHPSVLYSLAKFLNEIGSNFLEDGIFWISGMLQKNQNLSSEELENNTIYYLENLVRKYVLINRSQIRTNTQIKARVAVILNFLVEKGSITGYLLRENIL